MASLGGSGLDHYVDYSVVSGFHSIRSSFELLLQPFSLRYTHKAVQEGLRLNLQSHRGVPSHPRDRAVSPQLQLQQSTDASKHKQPCRSVVSRTPFAVAASSATTPSSSSAADAPNLPLHGQVAQ